MAPPRYFQYPAMMVAEVQRSVLDIVRGSVPDMYSLVDPFVGSGTMLTEAMRAGMSALGQDVNPLAVLVASTETTVLDPDAVQECADFVLRPPRIAETAGPRLTREAAAKWFSIEAVGELAILAGAIRLVPAAADRRFLWVALAETVRLCSNSRTSTYKLHLRTAEDMQRVRPARQVFAEIVTRNIAELRRFRGELEQAGRLVNGRYQGEVTVQLGDSRGSVAGTHDVLVTSPPYGDNGSTVPYGQASFLALAWVDPADISPDVPEDILATTLRIDHRSLGGSMPRGGWAKYAASALDGSPTLRRFVEGLTHEPRDRAQRVATFVADLDATLDPVLAALRPDAPMIWTIGNRRVGFAEVPLTTILSELLEARGCHVIAGIRRRIEGKRMASRNSVAQTIRHEDVVVIASPERS
jgi:hypothetical protein